MTIAELIKILQTFTDQSMRVVLIDDLGEIDDVGGVHLQSDEFFDVPDDAVVVSPYDENGNYPVGSAGSVA